MIRSAIWQRQKERLSNCQSRVYIASKKLIAYGILLRSQGIERVLFDCHAPKRMHFHINEDKEGQSFTCASISEAIQLFQEKVKEHFGEL